MDDQSFQICLDVIMNMMEECDDVLEEAIILQKEHSFIEFHRGQKAALTKVLRELNKVR